MKITHNKVGQNLNLVDGLKQDKADMARSAKDATSSLPQPVLGKDATRVELSDRAQEANRIKELALSAPDIDVQKVEKFRQLVDQGKYKIDARAIADRMVDEHLETMN